MRTLQCLEICLSRSQTAHREIIPSDPRCEQFVISAHRQIFGFAVSRSEVNCHVGLKHFGEKESFRKDFELSDQFFFAKFV